MQSIHKIIGVVYIFVLAVCLVAVAQRASSSNSPKAMRDMGAGKSSGSEPVPAFHSEAPKGPLPETMDPALFPEPVAQNAYTLAARIKKTLYQQPCYCHCDQSQGHGSLLDCFVSKHGAGCGTCMREDFYAYEQLRKGKTAAQIREGIERGDWQSVDTSKYEKPIPPPAH